MNEASLKYQRHLDDYVTFFETLNRRSLKLLNKHMSEGVYFKDPFNAVTSIEAVEAIFLHMFETLDTPKFKVSDAAFGRDPNTAYIKWSFTFIVKGEKTGFQGMSEVIFSDDGRVISHIDYWDAAEHVYEKIPLLGRIIRFVKSKISA